MPARRGKKSHLTNYSSAKSSMLAIKLSIIDTRTELMLSAKLDVDFCSHERGLVQMLPYNWGNELSFIDRLDRGILKSIPVLGLASNKAAKLFAEDFFDSGCNYTVTRWRRHKYRQFMKRTYL